MTCIFHYDIIVPVPAPSTFYLHARLGLLLFVCTDLSSLSPVQYWTVDCEHQTGAVSVLVPDHGVATPPISCHGEPAQSHKSLLLGAYLAFRWSFIIYGISIGGFHARNDLL